MMIVIASIIGIITSTVNVMLNDTDQNMAAKFVK